MRFLTSRWALGLLVVIGIGASIVLWQVLGDEAALPAIGILEIAVLVLALAAQLAGLASLGLLFRAGLRRHHELIQVSTALRAGMVAATVTRLVPAGGALSAPAMAVVARREAKGSSQEAIRSIILSYGTLLVWGGAGIAIVGGIGSIVPLGAGSLVTGIVVVAIGSLIVVGSTWLGSLLSRLPDWIQERLGDRIPTKRPTALELGWLGARFGLETAALWLTLAAFDIHLGAAEAVLVYALPQLLGGLTGLPGGIGVIEASTVGILAAVGVPAGTAVGPMFVYRIVSQWIPAAVGLAAGGATIVELQQQRERQEQQQEE